jgi:hypothetical protein
VLYFVIYSNRQQQTSSLCKQCADIFIAWLLTFIFMEMGLLANCRRRFKINNSEQRKQGKTEMGVPLLIDVR